MNRIALLAWLATAAALSAGEYNKKLNLGDAAPAFEDLPGTDDQKHALADFKDKAVVVVVFTCNSCPTAMDYEDRIIAFAKKHEGKVAVVAINVNNIDDDKMPKMRERAKEKGFNFPYLYDASQKVARDYGATYTPEFFVLDRERKVVYMGALDDRGPPKEATKFFVADAVAAALKGEKPAVGETLGRGCQVRYDRKKRP